MVIDWDTGAIERQDWGGGEVWFDGELIRKDGIFLTKESKPLNPENSYLWPNCSPGILPKENYQTARFASRVASETCMFRNEQN